MLDIWDTRDGFDSRALDTHRHASHAAWRQVSEIRSQINYQGRVNMHYEMLSDHSRFNLPRGLALIF